MRKIAGILFLLLIYTGVNAQILKPVKWTYEAKKVSDNVYDLIFKAKIDKGWHLYSQKIDGDGPVPTSFSFEESAAYSKNGETKEEGNAHEIFDEIFEMDLKYFSDNATFTQRVELKAPVSKIKGVLEFMVCDDEMCLPPEQIDYSFDVKYTKPSKDDSGQKPADSKEDKSFGKSSQKESSTTAEANEANPQEQKASSLDFNQPSPDAASGSGILKPVKWRYEVKSKGENQYELIFKADIEEGWSIYGMEKVEDGPVPTSFVFNDIKGVERLGEVEYINKPKVSFDPIFEAEIAKFEKSAGFKQTIRIDGDVQKVTGSLEYMACDDTKCLPPDPVEFSFNLESTLVTNAGTEEVKSSDPPGILFMTGFGLGLIALLTPCVFPMIPLTVSFFMKRSEKDQEKKKSGVGPALLFGLSIVLIFEILGILVSLLFTSDAVYGLATNPYMNMFFFLIFIIFAFSFLGAFEITLPSSWANKADAKSSQGGLIGIFFMAFTLAIVSFSCTVPFVGSLLVLISKGQDYLGPIAGMGGFAIAFALPFVLFAIFPSMMQKLPKSGGWLNSVKVVFGFIELAFALKFLSNVDLVYQWGILKREYFLALWIIIALLTGLYLLGKLRLSHDTPLSHISVPRLLLSIIFFAFAAYMVPGLWGAPLKLLSGLAPPHQYNEGFIAMPGATTSAIHSINNSGKKYDALFDAPPGFDTYFDYEEALGVAKQTGKPIMVDFTGHTCANCRKMEENIWTHPEVMKRLQEDYLIVSLYVDSREPLQKEDVYYSETLEKNVTTLGEKWLDMEASRYGTNAQPYYVLLDHRENTLVQPWGGYDPNPQNFVDFLDNGFQEFHSRNNLAEAK